MHSGGDEADGIDAAPPNRHTAGHALEVRRLPDPPDPDPVAHPATSDKDVYERYWFNGYSTSGDFYLGAGAALYQHLGVKDAHVSFIHEGRQSRSTYRDGGATNRVISLSGRTPSRSSNRCVRAGSP